MYTLLQLEISSRCYNQQPLVIQGAGAGNDTTAAGVLADIFDVQDLFHWQIFLVLFSELTQSYSCLIWLVKATDKVLNSENIELIILYW